MPQPDSSHVPPSERWSDTAPWPQDPEAPRPTARPRLRTRRSREHVEDARSHVDLDGNEEQARHRHDAVAPSSKPLSSQADSSAWVAALPFASEELEDTWPNLAGRSLLDKDR